jgi:hypothetical protein
MNHIGRRHVLLLVILMVMVADRMCCKQCGNDDNLIRCMYRTVS